MVGMVEGRERGKGWNVKGQKSHRLNLIVILCFSSFHDSGND